MIHPIWLTSFVEVVNRSTMAEASRHLHLTSAAISKHIFHLEKELGIQLFKRSTRKIDLTEEGLIYFEHAKQILESYKQAEAAVSYTKKEPTGTLKILCGPEFGNLYLIPHLQKFLDRYPQVHPHIELTQTLPDLEKEKVDVVVGLTTGIPDHWIQRTLTQARWVFCASPAYLKKYGLPKKPSDLAEHRLITRTQRQPNNVIRFKRGETIIFEPYLYFNDTRGMRTAALHGMGIVQLHDDIVAEDLKENRLIEILAKYTEQKKTLTNHISYLQTPHLHQKIRKFVDFMVDVTSIE